MAAISSHPVALHDCVDRVDCVDCHDSRKDETRSHPIALEPYEEWTLSSHSVSVEPYKKWALSSYPIDAGDYEYWYECPYCGCSSTDYSYVKSHILTDHGEEDDPV